MSPALVHLSTLVAVTLNVAVASCSRARGVRPDLVPTDTNKWIGIAVDDGDEVALLAQQLKVAVPLVEDRTAYLVDRPGLIDRLAALGYKPAVVDRQSVEQRVVRVLRRGTDAELRQVGIELINREATYWVVRGRLNALAALERMGYRLQRVAPGEPRPREVRITAKSHEDVQRIAAFGVDIYTARDTVSGVIVYGGAFDSQIDSLRAAGFSVVRAAPRKQ